jgi:hypothetical protein
MRMDSSFGRLTFPRRRDSGISHRVLILAAPHPSGAPGRMLNRPVVRLVRLQSIADPPTPLLS